MALEPRPTRVTSVDRPSPDFHCQAALRLTPRPDARRHSRISAERPDPSTATVIRWAVCDVGSVEVLLNEDPWLFDDGFETGDTLGWSSTVP